MARDMTDYAPNLAKTCFWLDDNATKHYKSLLEKLKQKKWISQHYYRIASRFPDSAQDGRSLIHVIMLNFIIHLHTLPVTQQLIEGGYYTGIKTVHTFPRKGGALRSQFDHDSPPTSIKSYQQYRMVHNTDENCHPSSLRLIAHMLFRNDVSIEDDNYSPSLTSVSENWLKANETESRLIINRFEDLPRPSESDQDEEDDPKPPTNKAKGAAAETSPAENITALRWRSMPHAGDNVVPASVVASGQKRYEQRDRQRTGLYTPDSGANQPNSQQRRKTPKKDEPELILPPRELANMDPGNTKLIEFCEDKNNARDLARTVCYMGSLMHDILSQNRIPKCLKMTLHGGVYGQFMSKFGDFLDKLDNKDLTFDPSQQDLQPKRSKKTIIAASPRCLGDVDQFQNISYQINAISSVFGWDQECLKTVVQFKEHTDQWIALSIDKSMFNFVGDMLHGKEDTAQTEDVELIANWITSSEKNGWTSNMTTDFQNESKRFTVDPDKDNKLLIILCWTSLFNHITEHIPDATNKTVGKSDTNAKSGSDSPGETVSKKRQKGTTGKSFDNKYLNQCQITHSLTSAHIDSDHDVDDDDDNATAENTHQTGGRPRKRNKTVNENQSGKSFHNKCINQ